MGRFWQYQGFNTEARKILDEKIKIGTRDIIEKDLDGNITGQRTEDRLASSYTKEEYQRDDVWYGEENVLYRYHFDDGRVLEDYVQEEPWSSGPCTFMALRDAKTKQPIAETLWSENDIASV